MSINIKKISSSKDNFSAKSIGSEDFSLDVSSDKVGHTLNKVPLIKSYEQRYERQNKIGRASCRERVSAEV